jgi:hypothetical protein
MLLLTASVFLPYSASFAGETTIYIYDALGRLVEVRKSGTINNAVNTDIAYDAAGNRTDYNVSGSDGAGSDGGVTGGVAGDFGDGGSGGGGSGDGGPDEAEAPPVFSINDVGLVEGEGAVFTINKAGAVQNSYAVTWFTSDGTANEGSDYGAASGTLTFAPGETAKQISIATIDDNDAEAIENFYINLNGTTGGATIGDPQGAATISDNEATNQPPVANDDARTIRACRANSARLSFNDTDADGDALEVISIDDPANVFTSEAIAYGKSVTFFTPNIAGDHIITYVVADTQGATDTGTLTITVPAWSVQDSCTPSQPIAAPPTLALGFAVE